MKTLHQVSSKIGDWGEIYGLGEDSGLMPESEIAKVLGVSKSTVHRDLTSALSKLRTAFAPIIANRRKLRCRIS